MNLIPSKGQLLNLILSILFLFTGFSLFAHKKMAAIFTKLQQRQQGFSSTGGIILLWGFPVCWVAVAGDFLFVVAV